MKTMLRFALAGGLAAATFLSPSLVRADDAPKPDAPKTDSPKADSPKADSPKADSKTVGVEFEKGTPAFADVLAKAKKDAKPVFIDFQTTWCGWCRRLEKDTYSQEAVGTLMKAFVNVDYDAEKDEGKDLAAKYHVHGFPTLVIVDAEGGEVDRIIGYLPPEKFKPEIERILKGEGTLPALKKKVAESPDDLALAVSLAKKLAGSVPAEAVAILEKVVDKAKGKDEALAKDAWTSLVAAAGNAEPADAEHALAVIERARKESGLPGIDAVADQHALRLHMQAIVAVLRRRADAAGDDPQALNELAWTCFELKTNQREAIAWAQKAVELSNRDAAILDTLANLLFATGKSAEAIQVEAEAVAKAKQPALKADLSQTLARFALDSAAKAAAAAAKAPAGDEDGEEDESDEK